MKVIDLLNKIANGEEVPKKFMYDDREFYLQSKDCWRCDDAIFEECFILEDLNKDIEIIGEDNTIPTLKNLNLTRIDINKEGQVYGVTKKEMIADIQTLQNWINEIIDYINKEVK